MVLLLQLLMFYSKSYETTTQADLLLSISSVPTATLLVDTLRMQRSRMDGLHSTAAEQNIIIIFFFFKKEPKIKNGIAIT